MNHPHQRAAPRLQAGIIDLETGAAALTKGNATLYVNPGDAAELARIAAQLDQLRQPADEPARASNQEDKIAGENSPPPSQRPEPPQAPPPPGQVSGSGHRPED